MKSLKISKLFRGYEFHEFHVFLQRVSERALARLGTSIGTICRDPMDKRWNAHCQVSQPGAARGLPAMAANFWPIGGAAPTPHPPRLRPRCPCYCSKFPANSSSRAGGAWQPASQAGRPGSRQGSLGKSPAETRGQPWGRHGSWRPVGMPRGQPPRNTQRITHQRSKHANRQARDMCHVAVLRRFSSPGSRRAFSSLAKSTHQPALV